MMIIVLVIIAMTIVLMMMAMIIVADVDEVNKFLQPMVIMIVDGNDDCRWRW